MVNGNGTEDLSIDKRAIGDVPSWSEIQGENMESVVKDLTSKVSSMSMKDREAGLFDLHGITGIDNKSIGEEQELIDQMRLVITDRLNWWAAAAFKMAESQNLQYTRDEKFLLMFLRCENYEVGPAVDRLFAFFKQKLRLFGPEKVGKRMITLDDLNADDMKCYSAGFFQLIPQRDHVGRAQLVSLPQYATWKKRENALRMIFHLFTTAAMDEETQKNGAVAIVHSVHDDRTNSHANDIVFGWDSTQLMQKAVPLRIVGQHVCTNPSALGKMFYSTVARFLDLAGISRIRFHQGSADEVEQQLSTFGISNTQTVITQSGEKKIDKHKEYLKTVKAIEHALSVTPEKVCVLVPSSTDILLGRGKPIQNHPGNVRLGLIVESQLIADAESAARQEKAKLAEVTMIKMQRAGMRFLTKENGYWEEVTSERIRRERVSSAFRTVRDRLKISQRNINVASSVRKRSQINMGETSYNKKLNHVQPVTLQ